MADNACNIQADSRYNYKNELNLKPYLICAFSFDEKLKILWYLVTSQLSIKQKRFITRFGLFCSMKMQIESVPLLHLTKKRSINFILLFMVNKKLYIYILLSFLLLTFWCKSKSSILNLKNCTRREKNLHSSREKKYSLFINFFKSQSNNFISDRFF